jgi:hypothetical protein
MLGKRRCRELYDPHTVGQEHSIPGHQERLRTLLHHDVERPIEVLRGTHVENQNLNVQRRGDGAQNRGRLLQTRIP